jgi:hypothetical protein
VASAKLSRFCNIGAAVFTTRDTKDTKDTEDTKDTKDTKDIKDINGGGEGNSCP